MPCPSVFARGERQRRPFKIEVKAFGVLPQYTSNRPWGSPWGLLSILTSNSWIRYGSSQNISSKACEISPAWACPMSQHDTTLHGQTSSVPADRTGGGCGVWHRALALHWRLHGGMDWACCWPQGEEATIRDRCAWCKDMYPPFPLATWHVFYSGFIPVAWTWDLNPLTSQWHF